MLSLSVRQKELQRRGFLLVETPVEAAQVLHVLLLLL